MKLQFDRETAAEVVEAAVDNPEQATKDYGAMLVMVAEEAYKLGFLHGWSKK